MSSAGRSCTPNRVAAHSSDPVRTATTGSCGNSRCSRRPSLTRRNKSQGGGLEICGEKGGGDFWGCRKEGERFVGLSRVFLLLFFGEFCVFVCRVWVEGGGEESL